MTLFAVVTLQVHRARISSDLPPVSPLGVLQDGRGLAQTAVGIGIGVRVVLRDAEADRAGARRLPLVEDIAKEDITIFYMI